VDDPVWLVLGSFSINLSPLLEIPLESSWKESWNQKPTKIDGEINQISHSQNPPKPKPCLVLYTKCTKITIHTLPKS
jgi:hypothetical protein